MKKGVLFVLLKFWVVNLVAGPITAWEASRFLSELLAIPSVTGNEKPAGEFVSGYCHDRGLYVTVFSELDSSYNFAASLYPLSEKKPNIILLSHIDVVPAGSESAWTHPPFSGAVDNGKIYGRGAVDAKGLLAMQVLSLIDFKDSLKRVGLTFPYNITALVVSGEETGGHNGTQYVIREHWEALNAAVVFGEGGAGVPNVFSKDTAQRIFGISVAEKSTLWLALSTKQFTGGHSAVPPALYANKKMIKVLIRIMNEKHTPRFDDVTRNMFRQISQSQTGLKKMIVRHINWSLFRPFVKKYFREGNLLHPFLYNTYVVTRISNPEGAANQMAPQASAILDCRILPNVDHEKFIKKIERLAEPNINVSVISESPDTPPSAQDDYYRGMEYAIRAGNKNAQVVPILLPVTTDNNYYRMKGVGVFGIMPACLGADELAGIHGPNEFLRVSSLVQGIHTFINFFKQFHEIRSPITGSVH